MESSQTLYHALNHNNTHHNNHNKKKCVVSLSIVAVVAVTVLFVGANTTQEVVATNNQQQSGPTNALKIEQPIQQGNVRQEIASLQVSQAPQESQAPAPSPSASVRVKMKVVGKPTTQQSDWPLNPVSVGSECATIISLFGFFESLIPLDTLYDAIEILKYLQVDSLDFLDSILHSGELNQNEAATAREAIATITTFSNFTTQLLNNLAPPDVLPIAAATATYHQTFENPDSATAMKSIGQAVPRGPAMKIIRQEVSRDTVVSNLEKLMGPMNDVPHPMLIQLLCERFRDASSKLESFSAEPTKQ